MCGRTGIGRESILRSVIGIFVSPPVLFFYTTSTSFFRYGSSSSFSPSLIWINTSQIAQEGLKPPTARHPLEGPKIGKEAGLSISFQTFIQLFFRLTGPFGRPLPAEPPFSLCTSQQHNLTAFVSKFEENSTKRTARHPPSIYSVWLLRGGRSGFYSERVFQVGFTKRENLSA